MDTRRATEGSAAGVLDSTSRSPTERNAVDMPGSAAAVESRRDMQASIRYVRLCRKTAHPGDENRTELLPPTSKIPRCGESRSLWSEMIACLLVFVAKILAPDLDHFAHLVESRTQPNLDPVGKSLFP